MGTYELIADGIEAVNEPALKNFPEAVNLNEIARRLLATHNDYELATNAFARLVNDDEAVRAVVMERCVRAFLRRLVRLAAHNDRLTATNDDGDRVCPPSVLSLADWGAAISAGLLDTMRVGPKLLGDVTQPELRTGSAAYATSAGDAIVKARWLALIADALPDATTPVRKALTEEAVKAFRDTARSDPWGAD